jgi:hypothetical protein
MPNPWVSLRRDQLIPVNKAVNEKEQLDKRAGGGGGKKPTFRALKIYPNRSLGDEKMPSGNPDTTIRPVLS